MHFEFFDPSIPYRWKVYSVCIIAFWVVMSIPMAVYAPKLNGTTSMDFIPPSGSDSQHGADALNEYFPSVQSSNQFAVVISGQEVWPRNKIVKKICQYIADDVVEYKEKHPGQWPKEVIFCTVSTYAVNGSYAGCLDGEYVLPTIRAKALVSHDRTLTLLSVIFTDPTGTVGLSPTSGDFLQDYAEHLRNDVIPHVNSFSQDYTTRATGILMLGIDGMEGTVQDMAHSDMIIIPIAFAVFTYYIRSLRLLLLPLLTLILSSGASFAVVYPISKYSGWQFMTDVPQTMMSCCLAISLDYNLFILMRFREGIENGFSIKTTVGAIVTHTCGHTIAISGILITLAWFGMMLIPAQPVLTQGLGTGIATMMVVFVNVTVTPALLTVFPGFFKVKTDGAVLRRLVLKALKIEEPVKPQVTDGPTINTEADEDDDETADDENAGKPMLSAKSFGDDRVDAQQKDIWYRVAKFVQRYPIPVMVVIILMGAPFYTQTYKVKTSLDPFQFVPRKSNSLEAWRDMAEKFPAGVFLPYFIVFEDATGNEAVNSSLGYEVFDNFTKGLKTRTQLAKYPNPALYIEGIMQFPNATVVELCAPPNSTGWDGEITWEYLYDEDSGLMVKGSSFDPWTREICELAYEEVFKTNTKNNTATFMTVVTPFQPTGPEATDFMDDLFNLKSEIEAGTSGFKIYITGGNTVSRDFAKIVDESTIFMLGSIIGFVCVVVLIFFRSAMLPLRMALTISYTVATTFGVTYYVFQTDAFHWMFPYLKDFGHAIFWAVPSMAICITVALGMDYDVFLLTRIYEYRSEHKYTSEAAIIKGLCKTGPIITGAGIIMTIAFAGLILSSCVALNQFGVILCVSVLLDTFVVRSLFVPATMFLCKEWVWWPRAVPEGEHTEHEFVDEDGITEEIRM
eukprot:TRINITY_DN5215_c1_g1_i1.p1 TRINITY_DN5215_c1_g1~~TRINITY_DN5215_c1_g1_i1.p1  ORF type:complete len:905 (+),score=169.70 TRINITY_DN5215_c1_g1_i1:1988-4702(+)